MTSLRLVFFTCQREGDNSWEVVKIKMRTQGQCPAHNSCLTRLGSWTDLVVRRVESGGEQWTRERVGQVSRFSLALGSFESLGGYSL